MSIKTRIFKIEDSIRTSEKAHGVGILQVSTNDETGIMEINKGDEQLFVGTIKDGEKFIAGLNYEVLIIDDIPDTRRNPYERSCRIT